MHFGFHTCTRAGLNFNSQRSGRSRQCIILMDPLLVNFALLGRTIGPGRKSSR